MISATDLPLNVSVAVIGLGGGLSEMKLTSCQVPSVALVLSTFASQVVQFCPVLQTPGGSYTI